MKKTFLIFFLTILATTSCERDDICIDDITPKLVISFFDDLDPDTEKNVNNINVEIIGFVNDDGDNIPYVSDLTSRAATDSIEVPLKVNEGITHFILTTNSTSSTESNADTLTVNYTTESIFIGRSCGFKSNFNNVDYDVETDTNIETDPDNWIKRFEVASTRIENKSEDEIRAHVKIFH